MKKLISIIISGIFFSTNPVHADIDTYFSQIKSNPKLLYRFFKEMPKGGELHYHLAGGPYPETMIKLASKGSYCINKLNYAVQKYTDRCQGLPLHTLKKHPSLYSQIIKNWSMKDFIPGKETGHDHFFNSFIKFMQIVFDYRPELIAAIMNKAAMQHELYMELMTIPDNARSLRFGQLIENTPSFDEKRSILLHNDAFKKNVSLTVKESHSMLHKARTLLGCDTNKAKKACTINIKFIYYSLREQELNNLFAQTLNAFEAASQSKGLIVGVNLVQPEDGPISLRDYQKQMKVYNYLHHHYPQVHIALHAGELTPQYANSSDLSYHIRDAVFTGQAERIGHGLDIPYEKDAQDTLKYMANNHIPVEINLISNKKILNISGSNHPLSLYLDNKVPVVLSTDDEGVLRTNLTSQYLEAALHHKLDYQTLKQINRNTLTYAFISGKSIWLNATKSELVKECLNLNSPSCHAFINQNQKAKLQWELEQQLNQFEKQFISSKRISKNNG